MTHAGPGGPVGGGCLDGARVVAVATAPDACYSPRRHARVLTVLPVRAGGVPTARGLAELGRRHEDYRGAVADGARRPGRERRLVAGRIVASVAELEEPARVEGRRFACGGR